MLPALPAAMLPALPERADPTTSSAVWSRAVGCSRQLTTARLARKNRRSLGIGFKMWGLGFRA